jgi:hypothetical protein
MAFFKYLGEPPRPGLVGSYGPTKSVRTPNKDGSWTQVDAPDPAVGFVAGDTIPYDYTDERALRCMRADTRFEELP